MWLKEVETIERIAYLVYHSTKYLPSMALQHGFVDGKSVSVSHRASYHKISQSLVAKDWCMHFCNCFGTWQTFQQQCCERVGQFFIGISISTSIQEDSRQLRCYDVTSDLLKLASGLGRTGGREIVLFPMNQYTCWRPQMKTFSVFLALCVGNSPVTIEFPSQRPVTRSFDVYFDLRLNKTLSKQSSAGNLRRNRAHYDVTVMVCPKG